MNEVRNLRSLKPGTELVIPGRERAPNVQRYVASEGRRSSRRHYATVSYETPKGKRAIVHVVQKGDTLSSISQRYSVRVDQIRQWNSVRAKKLRPGKRIKLYVRND